MRINHLLPVRRDTIFWALETKMSHPETKTIPSGNHCTFGRRAELMKSSTADCEELKETAVSLHFKNMFFFL